MGRNFWSIWYNNIASQNSVNLCVSIKKYVAYELVEQVEETTVKSQLEKLLSPFKKEIRKFEDPIDYFPDIKTRNFDSSRVNNKFMGRWRRIDKHELNWKTNEFGIDRSTGKRILSQYDAAESVCRYTRPFGQLDPCDILQLRMGKCNFHFLKHRQGKLRPSNPLAQFKLRSDNSSRRVKFRGGTSSSHYRQDPNLRYIPAHSNARILLPLYIADFIYLLIRNDFSRT